MSLLHWPRGDNDTDAFFPPDLHLKITTLEAFDYRLWSNHTVSNSSSCYIIGSPLAPNPTGLLDNGTFVNAAWCDVAVLPIGTRGITSLGLVVVFGISLIMTLVCLTRQGKLYLPAEARFRPVGRRWQWYWAIIVCGFAAVSLVMNVDVDRAYVLGLHIIITSLTWYLMQLALAALVWEAVRHWGSWQERQIVDPEPTAIREDDRRGKVEFWLPLLFYLWFWLSFFMLIPRNWGPLELQRAPDQTLLVAEPMATDSRVKVGAFMLVACYLTIVVSLVHSIYHYKLPATPWPGFVFSWFRHVPFRFVVLLGMLAVQIAYQMMCSFRFEVSVLNARGNLAAIFAGGYGPALVILLTQAAFGLFSTNEDRHILRQRRERDVQADLDLGIVKRPAWWRLGKGHGRDVKERLSRSAREISARRAALQGDGDAGAGGEQEEKEEKDTDSRPGLPPVAAGSPASAPACASGGIPARSTPSAPAPFDGRSGAFRTERTMQSAARLMFPNGTPPPDRMTELMMVGPPPPPYSEQPGNGNSVGDASSVRTPPPPPQQARSMLDV